MQKSLDVQNIGILLLCTEKCRKLQIYYYEHSQSSESAVPPSGVEDKNNKVKFAIHGRHLTKEYRNIMCQLIMSIYSHYYTMEIQYNC